jgi:hypothetical protein
MRGLDLWEKRVEGIVDAEEVAAAGAEGGEDGEGGGAKGEGSERLFVDDENSTNQQGTTRKGSTNMGECDQEVENNRGIAETEPEPELEIATGLEDMLLDDEEEQPTLDDQDLPSISQLESSTLEVPNPTREISSSFPPCRLVVGRCIVC